ncbi:MAG: aminotransferase class III-fold pyridoxal phosphate-dependent enzyme [Tepidisphaeraceae bacterium]
MLTPLQDSDRRHLLHPFTDHTSMHKAGTHVAVRGEGCWLIDSNGRRLLDGLAGLWCMNVGYGRAEIVDAVTKQMQELAYYPSFFNTTTTPTIQLAEKLATLAPKNLNHTIFCGSGSEANDTAIKLCWAYWKLRGQPKKRKLISRSFSYHGVTVATTSLTGLPSCTTPFDLPLDGFVQVPGPYAYGAWLVGATPASPASGGQAGSPIAGDAGVAPTKIDHAAYGEWCLAETRRIIEAEGPETIAAMFVEPVQGAGGVIVPPDGYLKKLRAMAREFDILFVADEVITGFGRLGAWFASELYELDPDLISIAKGLTSGYLPLGGSIVSDAMVDVLNTGGYLAHGYTYSGHPTACAAALANLAILENENLIPRTRDDTGPYFQKKLRELAGHHAVGEVRGEKLIGAIELLPSGGRAELAKTPNTLGAKAAAIAREEGVIVRGIRDLIAISPPLTISHAEIDTLFAGVKRTLDRLFV